MPKTLLSPLVVPPLPMPYAYHCLMSLSRGQFQWVLLPRPQDHLSLVSKLLNGRNPHSYPQPTVQASTSQMPLYYSKLDSCHFQSITTDVLFHSFVHAIPSSSNAFLHISRM